MGVVESVSGVVSDYRSLFQMVIHVLVEEKCSVDTTKDSIRKYYESVQQEEADLPANSGTLQAIQEDGS